MAVELDQIGVVDFAEIGAGGAFDQSDGFWKALDGTGSPTTDRRSARFEEFDPEFEASLKDSSFREAARKILISGYFTPPECVALCALFGLPILTEEDVANSSGHNSPTRPSFAVGMPGSGSAWFPAVPGPRAAGSSSRGASSRSPDRGQYGQQRCAPHCWSCSFRWAKFTERGPVPSPCVAGLGKPQIECEPTERFSYRAEQRPLRGVKEFVAAPRMFTFF